jgi:plasmid stabilization system protein ParE
MSRRLIVREEAEADITEAALWYEARGEGLGVDLMGEIGAVVRRIVESPLSFPLLRRSPEVRRALTRRFPYRVFFILRDDAVIVFSVMHAARHDRRWQARL